MTPEEQAVIEKAVIWYRGCGPYGPAGVDGTALGYLATAVEALHASCEPNTPLTDHARLTCWGDIPATWFVQTPKGDWLEVAATRQALDGGTQMVTFLGKEWARRANDAVTACPGARSPEAFDVLHAAGFTATILEDEPPW